MTSCQCDWLQLPEDSSRIATSDPAGFHSPPVYASMLINISGSIPPPRQEKNLQHSELAHEIRNDLTAKDFLALRAAVKTPQNGKLTCTHSLLLGSSLGLSFGFRLRRILNHIQRWKGSACSVFFAHLLYNYIYKFICIYIYMYIYIYYIYYIYYR